MGACLALYTPLSTRQTSVLDSPLKSLPECDPTASTAIVPTCWTELAVSDFVSDWWLNNSADCTQDGFAQCFLRKNKYPGLTCNLITVDTCPPIDTNNQYDSQQQFYTLWAIYSIHQYFSQYSTALSNSVPLASNMIGDIVLTVNPPTDTTVNKGLLAVILAGTIGVFGANKELLAAWQLKFIWAALQGVAGQAGSLTNYLYNKNTNDLRQEVTQMATIASDLTDIVREYQQGLATAIQDSQNDLDKFLLLTKNGAFTQSAITSLTAQEDTIYDDLIQFIFSTAMAWNWMFFTKQPSTNPVEVAQNTHNRVQGCSSLDDSSTCDQYFFRADTQDTYSFSKVDDCGYRFNGLLSSLKTKSWFTLEDMFVKAEECGGLQPFFDDQAFTLNCSVRITPFLSSQTQS